MKTRAARFYILLFTAGWFAVAPSANLIAAEDNTHEGLVVSTSAGRLAMTGTDGKDHSYDIGDAVRIMVNGHMGKLDDLKRGARIRVTTDKTGHALTVTTVDATKGQAASD